MIESDRNSVFIVILCIQMIRSRIYRFLPYLVNAPDLHRFYGNRTDSVGELCGLLGVIR